MYFEVFSRTVSCSPETEIIKRNSNYSNNFNQNNKQSHVTIEDNVEVSSIRISSFWLIGLSLIVTIVS